MGLIKKWSNSRFAMIQMFLIGPSWHPGFLRAFAGELKEDLLEAESDRSQFKQLVARLDNSLRDLRPGIFPGGEFKFNRTVWFCIHCLHALHPGDLVA